eukprot:gnl/Trimastix_PCT/2788.p1 GENE.gnl/Trimastix_PCT/2788~~gnl/Trimastix_PCT/2788.p1  ORF type:complete len:262 (-),score=45.82 gnl/Trimastix_PCT/2788:53-838(-)
MGCCECRLKQNCDFDDIAPTLNTGDLCLFTLPGRFGCQVRCCTGTPWVHIAMVYRPMQWMREKAGLPQTAPEDVLIIESEKHTWDGRKGGGLQIVSLRTKLATSRGLCGIRRLRGFALTPQVLERLDAFVDKVRDAPYQTGIRELLNAAVDLPGFHNETDLSSLFCSEFVAEALMSMGIMRRSNSSNEFTTGDFSTIGGGCCCCMGVQDSVHLTTPDASYEAERIPARLPFPGKGQRLAWVVGHPQLALVNGKCINHVERQ